MHITRERFDLGRHEGSDNYSTLPTTLNRFKMNCSSCHASFYVDKAFFDQIETAMEEGLDNPFICDDCHDELDELGHLRDH